MAGWSGTPLLSDLKFCKLDYMNQLASAIAERQYALGLTSGITRTRRRQVQSVADLQTAATAVGQKFVCLDDANTYEITSLGPPVVASNKGRHGVNAASADADVVTITNSLPLAGDVATSQATFASMQNFVVTYGPKFMRSNIDVTTMGSNTSSDYFWTLADLFTTAGMTGGHFKRVRYRVKADAGPSVGALALTDTSSSPGNTLWRWSGSAWVNIGIAGVDGVPDKLTFYGVCQVGDVMGSWLFDELQACLNLMVLTVAVQKGGFLASSNGHTMTSTQDVYNDNNATLPAHFRQNTNVFGTTAAAACSAVETWFSGAAPTFSRDPNTYGYSRYSLTGSGASWYASITKLGVTPRMTKPTTLKCTAKWYEFPQKENGSYVFDPGGGTYTENKWSLIRNDAANNTGSVLGDMTNQADTLPAPQPGAGQTVNRAINGMLAVCDWRCAGGFTYY